MQFKENTLIATMLNGKGLHVRHRLDPVKTTVEIKSTRQVEKMHEVYRLERYWGKHSREESEALINQMTSNLTKH